MKNIDVFGSAVGRIFQFWFVLMVLHQLLLQLLVVGRADGFGFAFAE